MAFLSQLLLGQYTTSTIGKFLLYIVTNTTGPIRMPVTALYREMGCWLMGLKKNTSSDVKTKMRLTPIHVRLIAS